MKKILIRLLFTTLTIACNLSLASGSTQLLNANINSSNIKSLQDGARTYMNYCAGCHSLKYMRFNRMAKDLELSEQEVTENLKFVGEKISDFITTNMNTGDVENWFGRRPPDLSLVGRSRSKDWLYTYLLSFYVDGNKATGTNNLVFKDVGMPHVLENLQGTQILNKQGHLELIEGSGQLSPTAYKNLVLNLVNFLVYASEPIKNYRSSLGIYVILFLLLLLFLSYKLKKEFWRDIH